jgi:hypothetical protein
MDRFSSLVVMDTRQFESIQALRHNGFMTESPRYPLLSPGFPINYLHPTSHGDRLDKTPTSLFMQRQPYFTRTLL